MTDISLLSAVLSFCPTDSFRFKISGSSQIDILPQTDFVFDIQISEKDLLELLPQKVYNIMG